MTDEPGEAAPSSEAPSPVGSSDVESSDLGSSDGGQTDDPLRRSRTSGVWLALIAFVVILLVLVIFVAQNTKSVHLSFLTFDWHAPLAVLILLAGIAGALLTAIAGTLRIVQLRRRVKRTRS